MKSVVLALKAHTVATMIAAGVAVAGVSTGLVTTMGSSDEPAGNVESVEVERPAPEAATQDRPAEAPPASEPAPVDPAAEAPLPVPTPVPVPAPAAAPTRAPVPAPRSIPAPAAPVQQNPPGVVEVPVSGDIIYNPTQEQIDAQRDKYALPPGGTPIGG